MMGNSGSTTDTTNGVWSLNNNDWMWRCEVDRQFYLYNNLNVQTDVTVQSQKGIYWHSDLANYGIYRENTGWTTGSWARLCIHWNTGILFTTGNGIPFTFTGGDANFSGKIIGNEFSLDSGDTLLTITNAGSYRQIQTWSSTPLSINPQGNNVGIGKTNPNWPLDVNGTIQGTQINSTGSMFIDNGGSLNIYTAVISQGNTYGNISITGDQQGGWNGIHFPNVYLMCGSVNGSDCGWYNGSAWIFYIDPNKNANVYNSLTVSAAITCYGAIQTNNNPVYCGNVQATSGYTVGTSSGYWYGQNAVNQYFSNIQIGNTCFYGNGQFVSNGGSFWCVSDQRQKDTIDWPNSDLNDILKLNVVRYAWKDTRKAHYANVGFLAQQVQAVFPNVIQTHPGHVTISPEIKGQYLAGVITLTDATGIVAGDKLEVLQENDENSIFVTVTAVSGNAITIQMPTKTSDSIDGQSKTIDIIKQANVLIVGKEVTDVLAIDHHQLNAISVSAIQQLNAIVVSQKVQLDELQTNLSNVLARLALLEHPK